MIALHISYCERSVKLFSSLHVFRSIKYLMKFKEIIPTNIDIDTQDEITYSLESPSISIHLKIANSEVRTRFKKFPSPPLGPRTISNADFCHYVSHYRYLLRQSSEDRSHSKLICLSVSVNSCAQEICIYLCFIVTKTKSQKQEMRKTALLTMPCRQFSPSLLFLTLKRGKFG
jgi:hypothetical protein